MPMGPREILPHKTSDFDLKTDALCLWMVNGFEIDGSEQSRCQTLMISIQFVLDRMNR